MATTIAGLGTTSSASASTSSGRRKRNGKNLGEVHSGISIGTRRWR